MKKQSILKAFVAGGSTVLILGLAACGSSPRQGGRAALGVGQETTLHTPQGETGTPHGHGSTAVVPNSASARMGADASPASSANPALGVGQESSRHTPKGETGTPHRH